MTIHTNTFPLVLQQAANTPTLSLMCTVREGKQVVLLFSGEQPGIDITSVLPLSAILKLAMLPQPVKINLVSNRDFKHMLECITPREPILV